MYMYFTISSYVRATGWKTIRTGYRVEALMHSTPLDASRLGVEVHMRGTPFHSQRDAATGVTKHTLAVFLSVDVAMAES